MEYDIRCEVDFPLASADRFGDLAQRWVIGAAQRLTPRTLRQVVDNPDLPRGALTSGRPCGPALAEWGFVSWTRRRDGAPGRESDRVVDAGTAEFVAAGARAGIGSLTLALIGLDEEGYPRHSRIRAHAEILEETPDWARVSVVVPERLLDDAEGQAALLAFVRDFADEVGPTYGQISYSYEDGDTTALETTAGPPWTIAVEAITESREVLRGYDWLTLCGAELTGRLGGVDALRATGAFAEVAPLRSGGTWLLATERYEDYTGDRVEAVWRALAPVLKRGTPSREMVDDYEEPFRLVFQDAAEA